MKKYILLIFNINNIIYYTHIIIINILYFLYYILYFYIYLICQKLLNLQKLIYSLKIILIFSVSNIQHQSTCINQPASINLHPATCLFLNLSLMERSTVS